MMEVPTANQDLDSAIQNLANALHAHFITFDSAQHSNNSTGHAEPLHYLIPCGIYGHGLWQHGDDVHLVCMTVNSPRIFWGAVAESLGLEEEKIRVPSNAMLLLNSLEGPHDGVLASLKHICNALDARVYLHRCSKPSTLNLAQLVGADRIDISPSMAENSYNGFHYNMVREARSCAAVLSQNDVLAGYYFRLRNWAKSNGILAPRLGLFLNPETLLTSILRAHDIKALPLSVNDEGDLAILKIILERRGNSDMSGLATSPHRYNDREALAIRNAIKSSENLAPSDGFERFLAGFPNYARIEALCWSNSPLEVRHFEEEVLPTFIQKVARFCRLWPGSFSPDGEINMFPIGLDKHDGERLSEVSSELSTEFDNTRIMVQIVPSTARELRELQGKSSGDSSIMTSASPAKTITTTASLPHKPRTERQIMSRLQHDPAHALIEYEVGYEDRFEGLKWMALEEWGRKPVEDDNFIPLTRIRKFRRKQDQAVVWDRKLRVDIT